MKEFDQYAVYDAVNVDLDNLVGNLRNTIVEDENVKSLQEKAIERISQRKRKLNTLITDLKNNSEWDTFTIAFYGETNAGKSTVIETLRILLGEKEKMEQRENFSRQAKLIDQEEQKYNDIRTEQEQYKEEYEQKRLQLSDKIADLSEKESRTEEKIYALENNISSLNYKILLKMVSSNRNLLMTILKKFPEQEEIKTVFNNKENEKDTLNRVRSKKNNIERNLDQEYGKYQSKNKQLDVKLTKISTNIAELESTLEQYKDGDIIGDQRSDFTREVKDYEFVVNDQKFKILDLPGIEGKEQLVKEEIEKAVKKAHAVIFVRKNITDVQIGGLEKIKKQLSQEQEVYLLYNKPVNSPRQLLRSKDSLLNDKESKALDKTGNTLKNSIGDAYSGYKFISALPAFLAVANLPKTDRFYAKQQKLLVDFTQEKLLDITKIQKLSAWMTSELILDSKKKIKEANTKKIKYAIEKTIEDIHAESEDWDEQTEIVHKHLNDANKSIENKFINFKRGIDLAKNEAISNFRLDVEDKINDEIDSDIDNDTFKHRMKKISEEFGEKLREKYVSELQNRAKKLTKEIDKILEKSSKNIQNELEFNISNASLNLRDDVRNFNVDIKSKNYTGKILGIITAGIAMLIPVEGWFATLFAIAGVVISVLSATREFFDHSYRKSNQRRARRKYMDEHCEKYREIFAEINDKLSLKVEEEIKKMSLALKEKNSALELTGKKYKETENKLKEIQNNL